MTLLMICEGRTDVGRRRDFNEDNFAIDLDCGLLTLADGMGGHAAGEVASGAEVKSINYLFPSEAAARLNAHLAPLGINVFFVKPPGVLAKLL